MDQRAGSQAPVSGSRPQGDTVSRPPPHPGPYQMTASRSYKGDPEGVEGAAAAKISPGQPPPGLWPYFPQRGERDTAERMRRCDRSRTALKVIGQKLDSVPALRKECQPMPAPIRIDPATGLKVFDTRAAMANDRITGKG